MRPWNRSLRNIYPKRHLRVDYMDNNVSEYNNEYVSEYSSKYFSEYPSKYVSEYTSEYISECTSECSSDYVREYISESGPLGFPTAGVKNGTSHDAQRDHKTTIWETLNEIYDLSGFVSDSSCNIDFFKTRLMY